MISLVYQNESLISFPELANAFVTHINGAVLARCESIDSPQKAEQFLAWLKNPHAMFPKRICVVQTNPPEEWEILEREHNLLLQLNQSFEGEVLHVNLPYFCSRVDSEYQHLTLLQNREALAGYGRWLNDEIDRLSRAFLPAMIDEYQLEGKLKDFGHEVKSSLLLESKEEILKTTLKLNAIENSGDFEAIKNLEKQLLTSKENLYRLMQAQEGALEQVEKGISKIEKEHPELLALKRKVIALRLLLTDMQHPRALFLHQLLNIWLEAATIVASGDGLKGVSFDFAARQALMQCARRYSPWELLNLMLHWEEIEEELAHFFQQKGADEFYFWLHVPAKNEEEEQRRKRLKPLMDLQSKFIDNLHYFGLPIIQEKGALSGKFQPWPELLALTPLVHELENHQFEPFVQTVKPRALTPQALSFYAPFF